MCEFLVDIRSNQPVFEGMPTAANIHVTGIVQGVGFRPFIYNLAEKFSLSGWVRNTSAGVDIHIEGKPYAIDSFLSTLTTTPPPLAQIDTISTKPCPVEGTTGFSIIHSEAIPGSFQPISPDVCICDDCLTEMFDPENHRYRYPFINCTNCGPRFTIIKDIPYDRPLTTMAGFPMCADCEREYRDPTNRRFHAQPIACPVCGPHVWLEADNQKQDYNQAIWRARELLIAGKILAIKGIGGFHIACDAANQSAVEELRRRKFRVDKPFAIMLPTIQNIEKHCLLDESSRRLLTSPQRPIVILKRRPESAISRDVAPGQDTIGVLLPYSPLHYLLFATTSTSITSLSDSDLCLVMTSGNISEEPIVIDNDEAYERLGNLVDGYLFHNRPINMRCDDTVIRSTPSGNCYPVRRSRGYTPAPVVLPFDVPPLLATGGELKNTFCLARDRYAFVSQHIGDMGNFETLNSFETSIKHFENLFHIHPQSIVCDLHPDYLATRYALDRANHDGLPIIQVQHHHAHIAACMAENGLSSNDQVIGIALDGTGYGLDGEIWGGEFLIANYTSFTRAIHLKYLSLPGGDNAIRKPSRIALAYLWQSGEAWDDALTCVQALPLREREILEAQLKQNINSPRTSSMGRLFDAIASIAGVRQQINYEAQAAIELEALVDPEETHRYPYELEINQNGNSGTIDPIPTIVAVKRDVLSLIPSSRIAARFHNTIADMVLSTCRFLREKTGIETVVLSGGVWQNITLLQKSIVLLRDDNFIVHSHHQVPTNDGGIALGQAAIAAWRVVRQ